MKCPLCGSDKDRVIDTRPSSQGRVIRRRRECLVCRHRWSTVERVEGQGVAASGAAQPKKEPPLMVEYVDIPVEAAPSRKVQVNEFIERLRAAQRAAREA